jgi:nicotinamidase-related amidase
MKRVITLFITLLLITSAVSFSQDVKEPAALKPALLVIDIQNAFLDMIPEQDREMGMLYINALIDLFRSKGYPVIRVYHSSKEYGVVEGTERFEFPVSVLIKPEDPRVIKTYPDGFNKTDLDRVIRESGSNTLFLSGLSAVGCVLATWIGAQNNDYKAFLVKDAIMSHNSAYTDNIEVMFDAVSYDVVKLIIESSGK